jgi:hypothetical protein
VAKFEYLGTTLTNRNDIHDEIKSRLNSIMLLFGPKSFVFRLISKNLNIKIHKTVILPVVLYGCETWSLTLREEHRLRVLNEFRKLVLLREAEPVSETLCRYFYKLLVCVPLCVCVYFILVFWPPCVLWFVSSCVTNSHLGFSDF